MAELTCVNSRIVGCIFSLYAMSDRFVEIIMDALKDTNKSKVWMETDDVSTCVRGLESHVFDVVKTIFVHAAKSGEHVVLSGTFTIGCPGDTEGDVYMSEDDVRMNKKTVNQMEFDAACQFALYPMGTPDYMGVIYKQVEQIKVQGLETSMIHYASRLDGNVHTIFTALEQAFHHSQTTESSHLVMTAVISANSPSKKS